MCGSPAGYTLLLPHQVYVVVSGIQPRTGQNVALAPALLMIGPELEAVAYTMEAVREAVRLNEAAAVEAAAGFQINIPIFFISAGLDLQSADPQSFSWEAVSL